MLADAAASRRNGDLERVSIQPSRIEGGAGVVIIWDASGVAYEISVADKQMAQQLMQVLQTQSAGEYERVSESPRLAPDSAKPSLGDGEYDEEANREDFSAAVNEWRQLGAGGAVQIEREGVFPGGGVERGVVQIVREEMSPGGGEEVALTAGEEEMLRQRSELQEKMRRWAIEDEERKQR
jgi:hypothetical protein